MGPCMSDNDLRRRGGPRKEFNIWIRFNNAAPKIIYTDKPSTLIVLDGEPKVLYDKNIEADKVVNSPQPDLQRRQPVEFICRW
jgi:hypothetical protein